MIISSVMRNMIVCFIIFFTKLIGILRIHIETLSASISLKIYKEYIHECLVIFADFRRDLPNHFGEPPTLIKLI